MQYWRKMYKFSLHATEFSVFSTRSRIWVRPLCHFPRLSKQTRWKIHLGPVKNKHDVKANNTSQPDLPQRDRHSFQHCGDTKRRKNANKNNFETNWRVNRWKFKQPSVGQSVNAQGNMGRGKGTFPPPPASTSPLAPATQAREREGNFHSLRISELAFKQNFHGFRPLFFKGRGVGILVNTPLYTLHKQDVPTISIQHSLCSITPTKLAYHSIFLCLFAEVKHKVTK